jgi:hypothetical protein
VNFKNVDWKRIEYIIYNNINFSFYAALFFLIFYWINCKMGTRTEFIVLTPENVGAIIMFPVICILIRGLFMFFNSRNFPPPSQGPF